MAKVRKQSLIVVSAAAASFMCCSGNCIDYCNVFTSSCLVLSFYSSVLFFPFVTTSLLISSHSVKNQPDSLSLTVPYVCLQVERSAQTAKVHPEGFEEVTAVTCSVSEGSQYHTNGGKSLLNLVFVSIHSIT